jgi:heme exporter protein D
LTMYMLSAGFYVWLGAVGIACIVFIGEHIKFAIEKKILAKKQMRKIPIGQVKSVHGKRIKSLSQEARK